MVQYILALRPVNKRVTWANPDVMLRVVREFLRRADSAKPVGK